MGGGDGDTFLKKSKDSVNFHKYEDFISGWIALHPGRM